MQILAFFRRFIGRSPQRRWTGQFRLSVVICILLAASTTTATDPLWVSTTPLEGNRQLVIVVDQQTKVLAIYHIDTSTGMVTLRSTRTLGYDLQLEDFNATDPRPNALKNMLQIGGTGQTANPSRPREGGASIVPAPGSVGQ